MGGDFVEDERPERPIEDRDDPAVPLDAPLVLLRVVGQIGVRE
jgi:hypothetical protein